MKRPLAGFRLRNWLFQFALLGGAFWLSAAGCLWSDHGPTGAWENHRAPAFSSVSSEDDNLAQVDVATARWRLGEPMLERDIWTELDEQFTAADQRQLLAQHGLRLGVMRAATGSKLQAVLSDPQCTQPRSNSVSKDVISWWTYVGDKLVEAPKAMPVCSVQARRIMAHDGNEIFWPIGAKINSALVLMPTENGPQARQLDQVEFGFFARLQKLPEGLTKVTMVPVVKYSLEQQTRTDIFLDSLRKKSGIQRHEERFDSLAVEVTLGNDQYLIVSSQPGDNGGLAVDSRQATFGELAFFDASNSQQVMLIIRGASVAAPQLPEPPKKGQAWPLAWQAETISRQ